MNISNLAVALVLLAFANPGLSEIYHWKDANGVTHFSDKQPKNQRFNALQPRPTPTIEPISKELETAPKQQMPPQDKKTAKSAPNINIGKTIDIIACADLQIELDTVKRTEAVFKDEEGRFHTHRSAFSRLYEGNRDYIDDKQRDALIEQLENKFTTQCSSNTRSSKKISQAMWGLTKKRNCTLFELYYKDQQRPKYRSSNSDLKRLRKKIDEYCAESDKKPSRNEPLDEFEINDLLGTH